MVVMVEEKNEMKKQYKILGFDTETFDGFVKVLACSDGSYIESSDTFALLDFLYNKMQDADYGFFYNIEFDLSAVIKPFLIEHQKEMKENRKVELKLSKLEKAQKKDWQEIKKLKEQLRTLNTLKRFTVGYYRVHIVNGKGFKITKIGKKRSRTNKTHVVEFFDVANFYKSLESYFTLDQVSEKYLGDKKNNEELGIDRKAIGTVPGYYESKRELIIKYCIKDCDLTARLGYKLFESLNNLGFSIPSKLYSKASIAKQVLIDMGYENHVSKNIQKIGRMAYHGGIFETFALGHYKDIINLDINSAYPAQLQALTEINLDNGNSQILTSESPNFEKCDYKFYHIKARSIPILQEKDVNGNIYYIDGQKYPGVVTSISEYWITEYDKRIIDEYGYKYEIIEAYGILNLEKRYPFKYINGLFQKKAEIKKQFGGDSIEYALQKIIINSTYGLLAQSRPKETKITNFIYASYITASCRYTILRIKKKLEEMGCSSLFIATDGIYSKLPSDKVMRDKALEYIKSISNSELGGFSSDFFKSVTIFENGVYVEELQNGKEILKRRGLSGKIEGDSEDETNSSTSNSIIEALKTCEQPTMAFKKFTPLKYKQAMIQSKAEEINIFQEIEKEINPYKSAVKKYKIDEGYIGLPLKDYFNVQIPLEHLTRLPFRKKINLK